MKLIIRKKILVPPAGFEPAISTLKGWRPGPLDYGGNSFDGANYTSISLYVQISQISGYAGSGGTCSTAPRMRSVRRCAALRPCTPVISMPV